MDEMSFFHQATVLICGSLDVEKSMAQCFDFLRKFIPLEMMELSIFDEKKQGVQLLSQNAVFEVPQAKDKLIPLSKKAVEHLKEKENRDHLVFFNSSRDNTPLLREICSYLKLKEVSGMLLPLTVDQEDLGSLVVIKRDSIPFDVSHGKLLSLLHDPIAMAMSNHLRYREVVRLKDMLSDDNRYLHQELHKLSGNQIIGRDYGLQGVMAMVRKVAPMDSSVMILGETGVGKEVIANAMHYFSPRRKGPLIKVNCGAIPDALIDSELFGHEKGAFTGAVAMKRGRFERAEGGTMFLDEVGELPPAAQVRLLRVIQERKIERVGGGEAISVDVRIIAATHRNLENMVRRGEFREDLWYRINVFPITIPPLRHRKSDIPAFVDYFIRQKVTTLNLRNYPSVSSRAIQRLQHYNWPGNVRELDNVVERELIKNQAVGGISRLEFPEFALENQAVHDDGQMKKNREGAERNRDATQNKDAVFKKTDGQDKTPPTMMPILPSSHQIDGVAYGKSLEGLNLDEVMKRHIHKVLKLTRGKIQGEDGAAALLGLHPSTLRHRMRRLGIPFGKKHRVRVM